MSACVGAVAGGLATYYILDKPGVLNRTQQAGVAACLCFFVGAAMSSVLTSLLLASTRAVFAAWAMSPHALVTTHPAHAAKLGEAWKKAHPAAWEACGYGDLVPSGAAAVGGAANALLHAGGAAAAAVVVPNPVRGLAPTQGGGPGV